MTTMVKLVGLEGPFRGKSRVLTEGEYLLGRENSDVTIPDPKVSTRHAKLRIINPHVTIEDLDSLNGTFVNDSSRNSRIGFETLEDRDTFALGPNTVFGIQILQLRAAGFWIRLLAFLLDGLVLAIIQLLGGLIINSLTGLAYGRRGVVSIKDQQEMKMVIMVLVGIWQIVAFFVYMVLMNGARGQTLGKMATGIKIIHADGNAVSYGAAFLRCFIQFLLTALLYAVPYSLITYGYPLSNATMMRYSLANLTGLLLLGIMYIFLAVHPEKRGLYELAADTRVVHVKELEGK